MILKFGYVKSTPEISKIVSRRVLHQLTNRHYRKQITQSLKTINEQKQQNQSNRKVTKP